MLNEIGIAPARKLFTPNATAQAVLTDSEKEKLFEMLHGDMGLKCPHGRPIAVKMTKYEIEKMFKRIV